MRFLATRSTLFMAGMIGFGLAYGDEASDEVFYQSMPMVLTASRLAQSPLDAPASITVIDREMIDASGFTEVYELLRLVPGFLVTDWLDGHPSVANHGLGDAQGRRVKVMIDGQTVNSPLWGDVYWTDLPIRVDDIERLEVVRGPNGAAYGSNAFQGVVNIITRSPLAESGSMAGLGLGVNGEYEGAVRLNGEDGGKVDWRVTASKRRLQPFESFNGGAFKINERSVLNAAAHVQLNNTDEWITRFGISDGRDQMGYPAGPDSDPFYPAHDEPAQEYSLHTAWQRNYSADSALSVQYYHQAHKGGGEWLVEAGLPGLLFNQNFETRRDSHEAQYTRQLLPSLHVLLGGQLRQDAATSSFYFGTEQSTHTDEYWQTYLSLDWKPLEALNINLGGALEHHGYSGQLFSPRVALNYALNEYSSLRISASTAYRAPSMMESYAFHSLVYQEQVIATGYRSAYPMLPERIRQVELGYVASLPSYRLQLDARIYYEKYDRYIDDVTCIYELGDPRACDFAAPANYAPISTPDTWVFVNQGGINTRGAELSLDWRPGWGRILLSQSFENIRVGDGPIDKDTKRSAPTAMTSLLLIKPLGDRWRLSAGFYHQNSMMWLNDGDRVPSRALFNLKLTHKFGRPGSHNEFSITALSMNGDYPEFRGNTRHEPRLFATLKVGL